MTHPVHPLALFRLMVLGPLASRGQLKRGELKSAVRELAQKTYDIPGSGRCRLSEESIRRWYYAWQRGGIEALIPKTRQDRGKTRLPDNIAGLLLQYRQENPARSIRSLIHLLEQQGIVARNTLSRASVHRLLQNHRLSKRIPPDINAIERRSFVAERAGDIWQGDVLHGPTIQTASGMRKTYLVSLMDDASRFITHSAFCLGETALDIEGVLKQAVLKYGLPHRLIIDNGAAYRAQSLQSICARLEIRLIYCPPYEPEGKGKLERFHRTFRSDFLSEINAQKITGLDDLNARLWAWCDQVYHTRIHSSLSGKTPRDRWREDLVHIRHLGLRAEKIDSIFHHEVKRLVYRDGTVSWEGMKFEVPHGIVDRKVMLIVDPHTRTALRVTSVFGDDYGPVVRLDREANLHRKRQRPAQSVVEKTAKSSVSIVDLALKEQQKMFVIKSGNKGE